MPPAPPGDEAAIDDVAQANNPGGPPNSPRRGMRRSSMVHEPRALSPAGDIENPALSTERGRQFLFTAAAPLDPKATLVERIEQSTAGARRLAPPEPYSAQPELSWRCGGVPATHK